MFEYKCMFLLFKNKYTLLNNNYFTKSDALDHFVVNWQFSFTVRVS